jgi:hypothetical protein
VPCQWVDGWLGAGWLLGGGRGSTYVGVCSAPASTWVQYLPAGLTGPGGQAGIHHGMAVTWAFAWVVAMAVGWTRRG